MIRLLLLLAVMAGWAWGAEPAPVVKKHSIVLNGRTLEYTTTTGRLPIANEQGEAEAHIFFVAYTLDKPAGDNGPAKRPLMFSFNGGPGSASSGSGSRASPSSDFRRSAR